MGGGTQRRPGERAVSAAARPITVLHTVRWLRVDGVAKVILRNLRHLDRTRFRHYVCSIRADEGSADEFRAEGVEPFFLDHVSAADTPRSIYRAGGLIRRLGVDVVHANRTIDLLVAGSAARLHGRKVVSSLHWLGRIEDHPEDPTPFWRQQIYRTTQVQLNRAIANRIVAVSGAVRDTFAELPGFPVDRVDVVYPGIDLEWPLPAAGTRSRLRTELGVGQDTPLVLNVGRLHPVKGQEQLIGVMALVRQQVPDAVLLIAGDGELHATLAQKVEQAGAGGFVRLLGSRSDVDDLIAVSDVVVVASESEAAALPLVEAMRGSRPLVATAVGGTPEIVADGETGYLVPRADVPAMAAALVRLLADPESARRMGQAGRRRVEERFDLRSSAESLERIYASLAGAAANPWGSAA